MKNYTLTSKPLSLLASYEIKDADGNLEMTAKANFGIMQFLRTELAVRDVNRKKSFKIRGVIKTLNRRTEILSENGSLSYYIISGIFFPRYESPFYTSDGKKLFDLVSSFSRERSELPTRLNVDVVSPNGTKLASAKMRFPTISIHEKWEISVTNDGEHLTREGLLAVLWYQHFWHNIMTRTL
jgi:hypothetical protein